MKGELLPMTDVQQAKDYLNQIQKTNRLIKRLNSTIATLRAGLTSQNYELSADRVQSSGAKDPIGETFAKISGLETDIQNYIRDLYVWEQNALARIYRIPDFDQRNVLIARYIENRKWDQIAVDINFSKAQVHKIHGAALIAFVEVNPDILKDDTSVD